MVTCSCGKVIDKVPNWMQGISVNFICNNCPNRQHKNIAFVNLEPAIAATAKIDEIDVVDGVIGEPEA